MGQQTLNQILPNGAFIGSDGQKPTRVESNFQQVSDLHQLQVVLTRSASFAT
jgi:hypothetical protein